MKIIEILKSSNKDFKKNLILFFIAYFFVLFNYPLIRAATTSIFFENHGAKSTPGAWVWAVIFLSFSIFICNKIQKTKSVQFVFTVASIASALIFFAGMLPTFGYFPFIWKEIYIVLQIHLLLAYANNFFPKDLFKLLIGPLGAIGSFGGVLGGLFTTYLSANWGTLAVLQVGVVFVALPIVFFIKTKILFKSEEEKKKTPLASLDSPSVKKYVFYIAGIVALTQFIINIVDFKFNMAFEAAVPTKDLRTTYLGQIYAWTNAVTFFFQFVILPYALVRITERKLHFLIPLSYLICILVLMFSGQFGLAAVAGIFIYFKASDYSFFSAAKELLYQPLSLSQKYGAKYLTDMLVYRASKATIGILLIYLQSSFILDIMMLSFLLVWILIVFKLFELHKKLFENKDVYAKPITSKDNE